MYAEQPLHTPKAPALPSVGKTFGVLALVAAVVYLPLFAATNGLPAVPGFTGPAWKEALLSAFLLWSGITGVAAGVAFFAVIIRYRKLHPPSHPETYPGLMTGLATLLIYTATLAF